MSQEEKQLLLIDLCARLPYGVIVRHADQIIRGYKEGYYQAEKDLELTVEDIVHIIETYNELEFSREFATVTFNDTCKEVLKRFKDLKK